MFRINEISSTGILLYEGIIIQVSFEFIRKYEMSFSGDIIKLTS